MEKMKIVITGPQGCGKTLAAQTIAKILRRIGACVSVKDERMPMDFLSPQTMSILKSVLGNKKISISIHQKDSPRLSVDDALGLVLGHDDSVVCTRDDRGSVGFSRSDFSA